MAPKDHGKYSKGGGDVVQYEEVMTTEDIETFDEAEKQGSSESWLFWSQQMTASLAGENRFREEARQAEKSYFGDDGKAYTTADYQKTEHETNIIHANIEVLKPLVYSTPPDPIVRRRFGGDNGGGAKDPTDRIAALTCQRLANFLIETSRFDEAMELCRDDWLVPGRGTCRVMYHADFEKKQSINPETKLPEVNDLGEPVMVEVKSKESVKVRHWPWARVMYSPANTWDEVLQKGWIAFENPLTKKEIRDRFDKDDDEGGGNRISEFMNYPIDGLKGGVKGNGGSESTGWEPDKSSETSDEASASAHDQCIVFEIWDKATGRVIWWSPHYQEDILDQSEDPLGLEDFFNCPKPLLAVTKNGMLTPRPDTAFYRARAAEVDVATRKLADILKAISLSGAYPGKMNAELKTLLNGKNKMIPIEEWIAFIEKGGTAGIIQWLPLDQFITAAQALISMREQAKQALYEVSGVSDIVRGQSDPNETLGAQQIKGNYANLRLRDKQGKMHKFARSTIRIMVEIAVEHFDTKTIMDIVNIELPETEQKLQMMNQAVEQSKMQYSAAAQAAQAAGQKPPPEPSIPFFEQTSWERVHESLRNDMTRKFSLSIETNGTILEDAEEDKKQRVEFLQAFSSMAESLFPMAQSGILDMKVIKELLLFAVRGFPKSRTLEGMLESLPDTINTEPKEATAVTVANIKAESDKLITQMKLEVEAKGDQDDKAHDMRMAGAKIMADGFMKDLDRGEQ